jgi:hypothetical protein
MVEDVYINTSFESHYAGSYYTHDWLHIIKVHSELSIICESKLGEYAEKNTHRPQINFTL